jgi:hypothetical protein
MTTLITRKELQGRSRNTHAARLFGVRFLWIESFVFETASSLSEQYEAGRWDYFVLSNRGFYMAPSTPERIRAACANGFNGELSRDAFGMTCCLYAYSFLSFSADRGFAEKCATHFHRLREAALLQPEALSILSAID